MNLKKVFDSADDEYVDLGLPSGTLWKSKSEPGEYDFRDAVSKFGNSLPTKEQIQELLDNCDYRYIEHYYGVFTSRVNGSSLSLPIRGYGYKVQSYGVSDTGWYWSSSVSNTRNCAYILDFSEDGAELNDENNFICLQVVLVK